MHKYAEENPKEYFHIDLKQPFVVYAEYAADPETPRDILTKLSKHTYTRIRKELAKNPSLTNLIFTRLSKDSDEGVREALAENTATPSKILDVLAGDSSENVRSSVAFNPKVTERILTKLANDESVSVLRGVASNQNTPPHILSELYNTEDDSYFGIKAHLATNPNTPIKTLNALAAFKSGNSISESDTLVALSKNPGVPLVILKKLLKRAVDDAYYRDLQISLILNPKIPNELLHPLATVSSPDVREALVKRIGNIDELEAAISSNKNRLEQASSTDTDQKTLDALARSKELEIRAEVAENPNTSPQTLVYLASDSHGAVLKALLDNKNTPTEGLKLLVNNIKEYNASQLIRHPQTTTELLEYLYSIYKNNNHQFLKNEKTPEWILQDILNTQISTPHVKKQTELVLLERDNLPLAIFKQLYKSEFEKVREGVLQHHNLPNTLKSRILNKHKRKVDRYQKSRHNLSGINLKDKSGTGLPQKTNSDLELLLKLKGYLKND